MKILQINSVYKEKSTGRTCYEVEKALSEQGHHCITAYGYGKHDSLNVYRIHNKFAYAYHKILSKIFGYEGYFSYCSTHRLIRFIKNYKPDVIHLRNLHEHYLCLPLLFDFLHKYDKPVIMNLHDFWDITGGCVYFSENKCDGWKTGCKQCAHERLYSKGILCNNTAKMWKDKNKWYKGLDNLVIVGVSEWVAEQARQSMLKNRDIRYIYNWINTNVFYPRNDIEYLYDKYNIPKNKFIILGVSAQWSKGSTRYENFIKLSNDIEDNYHIVLVGKCIEKIHSSNISYIDFISDINELAKLYSLGDVYVHMAYEDTFGKVIAEAMACGLPTIVFNATCYPEIVSGCGGLVVEKDDITSIKDKIEIIRKNGKSFYSQLMIDKVNDNYLYSNNVNELIELYKELCNNN